MARYYNADTLLEFVKQNTPHIDGQTTMQCVERAILETPTADVVEVVYCKDCEYNENGVCIHPDNITHSYDSDDNVYDYYISVWSGHFCSYGRRTDNDV